MLFKAGNPAYPRIDPCIVEIIGPQTAPAFAQRIPRRG
jgi:hypothetical protein